MCEVFNNIQYCLIDGHTYVGNDKSIDQNAIVDIAKITEDLIIPTFIGSKKIDYIGQCAFRSCKVIKRVIIEARIKTIKYAAFEYCTSLQSINIPSSVTLIDYSAIRPTNGGAIVQGSLNIIFEKGSKIKSIFSESLRGKQETNIIFCDNREITTSDCRGTFIEGDNPNIYSLHSFCGYEPKGKPFGCYRRENYCTNNSRHSCKDTVSSLINIAIMIMLF